MSKDSIGNIILVATTLCIVCSVIVSSASVGLRPMQEVNKLLDFKRNVLVAGGMLEQGESVTKAELQARFSKLTPRLVELGTGEYLDVPEEELAAFDARAEAKDPATSVEIPPSQDIASIKRRAKRARIYVDPDGGLILPIYGMGLWGRMYGYISLADDDVRTVRGLVYYEHKETPGLGGEVDNPIWRGQFEGKKVYDVNGKYRLEVLKGAGNKLDEHSADGMSGATITTRGVDNMLEYWLGPEAFGPLIAKS